MQNGNKKHENGEIKKKNGCMQHNVVCIGGIPPPHCLQREFTPSLYIFSHGKGYDFGKERFRVSTKKIKPKNAKS